MLAELLPSPDNPFSISRASKTPHCYDKIRFSFIDPPWEKFSGNRAVQREISSSTRVKIYKYNKKLFKDKQTIYSKCPSVGSLYEILPHVRRLG